MGIPSRHRDMTALRYAADGSYAYEEAWPLVEAPAVDLSGWSKSWMCGPHGPEVSGF